MEHGLIKKTAVYACDTQCRNSLLNQPVNAREASTTLRPTTEGAVEVAVVMINFWQLMQRK